MGLFKNVAMLLWRMDVSVKAIVNQSEMLFKNYYTNLDLHENVSMS